MLDQGLAGVCAAAYELVRGSSAAARLAAAGP